MIKCIVILQPLVWEYAWCCSLPFVFYGLSSLRRNIIRSMSVFVMGNIVFALLPVLFSLAYYLNDFYKYITTRSSEGLMLWQVITMKKDFFSILFSFNYTNYHLIILIGISLCFVVVCFFTSCPASSLFLSLLCPHSDCRVETPRRCNQQEN